MNIFSKEYFQFNIFEPLMENLNQYREILYQFILAFIILTLSWIVAKTIQLIVKFILRLVYFDKLSDKSGFTRFLEHSGLHNIPSTIISSLFYWIVIFIGFTIAVEVFGVFAFPLVQKLIIYVPYALASVFVIIMGMAIAVLLSKFLQSVLVRAGLVASIAKFFKPHQFLYKRWIK